MVRRKHREIVDGKIVSETFWSLSEELALDSRIFYWKMFKAALDVEAQGWPADIEELRQRYRNGGTLRAVNAWIEWKGEDPAAYPAAVKQGAAAGVDFAMMAVIFFHRSEWQAIFDGAPVDENA